MPEAARLRAAMERAARAYLDYVGDAPGLPFVLRLLTDSAEYRLSATGLESGCAAETAGLEAFLLAHFLAPTELAVCRCLLPGPKSFEGIAAKLPDPPGETKLRLILAQLGRRGLVDTGDDGYFLTSEQIREVLARLAP
jgi:hypothetical protein